MHTPNSDRQDTRASRPRPTQRPAAFSLIDLWAILAILAVLFAAFGPTAWYVRRGNGRIACASNLRQIGMAIQLYANENGGKFPRARYDPAAENPVPTAYTKWQSPDPFAPDGPGPNDVTAALYLLMRTQDITSDVFVCPEDGAAERWLGGAGKDSFSNLPGRRHLSYSLANPYVSPTVAAMGFKWDTQASADFAVAADMNPGTPELLTATWHATREQMARVNSFNHERAGQNVLYADGRVEWCSTPFVGSPRVAPPNGEGRRDHIYTFGASTATSPGAGVAGAPVDAQDSVLLPTAGGVGPPPVPPEPKPAPVRAAWWFLSGLPVSLAAAGLFSLARLAVRRRRVSGAASPPPP